MKGEITLREKAEESITWEECKAISEELIAKASAFDEALYQAFPAKKGLYIFCYDGTELGGSLWEKESPIIYIGRAGADSIRHWRDNTGVSTVRRSLAAMLASALALEAIPGSDDPEDNDRYTNYRLTPESETKLTEWMLSLIHIFFYPMAAPASSFPGSMPKPMLNCCSNSVLISSPVFLLSMRHCCVIRIWMMLISAA